MRTIKVVGILVVVLGLAFFAVKLTGLGFTSGTNEETTFNASDVTAIDISADIAEIDVTPFEGNDIVVQINGHSNVSAHLKSGILSIHSKEKRRFWLPAFMSEKNESLIAIQVPENMPLSRLTIQSGVADIRVNHSFNEVDIDSKVGDLWIDHVTGKTNIQVDVGSITFSTDEMIEDIHLETEVGDISASLLKVPETLNKNIQTTIGESNVSDLDYTTENDQAPTLFVKSEIGDIHVTSEERLE